MVIDVSTVGAIDLISYFVGLRSQYNLAPFEVEYWLKSDFKSNYTSL